MKNLFSILLALLFLNGCTGAFSKVKNIVSFTNQLKVESPDVSVHIPHKESLTAWKNNGSLNKNIAIETSDISSSQKSLFSMISRSQKVGSREMRTPHSLKFSGDIAASPVIVDNKIIILSTNGNLSAFDSSSFKKIWETQMDIGGQYNGGGITYYEGKLFVANGSKMFNVIDPTNGNRIIAKQFPDILITAPTVHNNLVLLLTMGNQLYAMDRNKNTFFWDHAGIAEMLTSGKTIAPLIDSKGRIFVSYSSGQLFLLDPQSGSELWQFDLSQDEHLPGFLPVNISANPVFSEGSIYIAENNGEFYKLDSNTGMVIWKKKIEDVQTMNIFGNVIVLTTNGRQVAALNKDDGKIIWVTDIVDVKESDRGKLKPIEFVSSLMINDVLTLYTRKGDIYKISPLNGAILNTENLGKRIGFVAVADKVILFSGSQILVSK